MLLVATPNPTSPDSIPGTAWHHNWCLHIFSLFLFFPSPNNPAHVSAHFVSPFVFHVVFCHSSEAPPPLHPFCCLVALFIVPKTHCFVLFFSFLFSFGLFSLTCPCMQQSDFREAPDWDVGESRSSDLYRISSNTSSTIDVDPKMELDRSYMSYRPEEKDSYVSEVCACASKGWVSVKGFGLIEYQLSTFKVCGTDIVHISCNPHKITCEIQKLELQNVESEGAFQEKRLNVLSCSCSLHS